MTLIAELKFVSTFALKPSNVTNMSGRTLLLPTPYAIKMALIDRAIVRFGFEKSKEIFPAIRDLRIYWAGPLTIGVMQVIEKGYRLARSTTKSQIRVQEYCTYSGSFYITFESKSSDAVGELSQLIRMLFRLGRSGSIINCEYLFRNVEAIDRDWISLGDPLDYSEITRGIVQRMDDMRHDVSLTDVSTYNLQSPNQLRFQYDIIIPYKLGYASDNFIVYERIES